MIKLIVCIAITTVSFLIGNEVYNSQKAKLKALKELKEITSDIIICISFLSLDVFDICKRVFLVRKNINTSSFLMITSGDFPSLWQEACNSLEKISEDDRIAFSEIGGILGSCDCESQIKKLSMIEKTLERSYQEKSEKLNANKQLYYIVSVCIGLVICLVAA